MSAPSAASFAASAARSAADASHSVTDARRSATVHSLRQQLLKSRQLSAGQQIVSTGIPALDALLPDGGLPAAAVVEWVSESPGLSAASLALRCLCPGLTLPGCVAVVDARHEFHAPAAAEMGISLSRLLLIRPVGGQRESLWALEQTARCGGVRAVLCWLDQASSTVLRRLQLAVERSGATVFLIRPEAVLKHPSWADYRLHVGFVQRDGWSQTLSIQLLRSRHSVHCQRRILLKINDETGAVSEISELADPASAATAAG